ncbi:MAG: hypothetical protein K0Q83_2583, partial [Deltaproteobacteria bacterium]|nr:hypothetical protein [Deltaproteobacteria bacterium]
FLTIELGSNGIFQSPEIPAANDDAARCDEKKNDQGNAKEAKIGFFQTIDSEES